MGKFKTPPKQEVSSKSTKTEMKSTRRRRKVIYPSSGSKDVPTPSKILDTLEANPSLDKSLGEDIISPMKDVSKGRGGKGHQSHRQHQRTMWLDRLEKSMHDLANN